MTALMLEHVSKSYGRGESRVRAVDELPESSLPSVRRERIGFIFQSFQLLTTLTAQENVEIVLQLSGRPNVAERARNLLDSFGLERRRDFMPATAARQQGKAVVIVSHDSRIRGIANRVLWMEDGRFTSASPAAMEL